MSGHWPPPPGWEPTGPVPSTAEPGHPGPAVAPPQAPAPLLVMRPGAIPLRPLGLGDILDSTFRIIRRNAGATVGAAVLVAAASMVIPLLVALWVTASPPSFDFSKDGTISGDPFGFGAVAVSLMGAAVVQGVGLLLVAAMATPVTLSAAIGGTMTMREAWRATRGKRWRLIGLTVMSVLVGATMVAIYAVPFVVLLASGADPVSLVVWGAVATPVMICAFALLWIRCSALAAPCLMAEPGLGVIGAFRRAFALSRRQFWRVFGIILLTVLMTSIGGGIIAMPVSIGGQLLPLLAGGRFAALGLVAGQALSGVVQAAFTTPVLAVVTSLLYVDERIRKEAFDVELMDRAGLTA